MANRLLESIQSNTSSSAQIPVSSNRLLSTIQKNSTTTPNRVDIASLVREQQQKATIAQPTQVATPVIPEKSWFEKLKEFVLPTREDSAGKITEDTISKTTPTLKESIIGGAKFVGEMASGVGSLPSIATSYIERKLGNTQTADYLDKLRQESVVGKVAELSRPSTPGEAKVMRVGDVLTLVPGLIKKSITKALITASTKEAVLSTLKKEGLSVGDNIAEQIAKESDPKKIGALLNNENIAKASKLPTISAEELGAVAMEKARKAVAEEPKQSFVARAKETVTSLPGKMQEAFTTRFAPVQKFANEELKKAGVVVKEKNSLIKEFENYTSDRAAAAAKVNKFKTEVIDQANKDGLRESLKEYLFIRRTKTRVDAGVKTGDWTSEMADAGLGKMKSEIGDEKFAKLEILAGRIQDSADEILNVLVSSGVLSKEGYAAVKARNDFYAPFKLLKHIGDEDIIGNAGKSLNLSSQEVIKAMKGISTDAIRIADPIDEIAKKIYQANLVAAKNRIMKKFAELAELKDSSIRKIRTAEKVQKKIQVVRDIKSLGLNINKLRRILKTSNTWANKLKSEINRLNIKGLKFALGKKSSLAKDKKVVNIRSRKNSTIAKSEEKIKALEAQLKNIPKKVSKEFKTTEDGVTFIEKGSKKVNDAETTKRISKLNDAIKAEKEKLTELKKTAKDDKEFIYATTTTRETQAFVNELINLPDAQIEAIKRKIGTREPKLANILEQIQGIKDAINVRKAQRGALKSEAEQLSDLKRSAAAEGKDIVHYMDDGIVNMLEVPRDVARSIKGLNAESLGVISQSMRFAMVPARAGITTLNVGFQAANAIIDALRLATISKFRIKNPVDAGLFVYDYARSFIESIGGNADDIISGITKGNIRTKGAEYTAAESAGMFSGTVYNSYLKEFGKTSGPVSSKIHKSLDVFDRVGNAIEETSKLAGYRRGLRMLKKGDISKQDLLYEVRNYSGSPDFSRGGTITPEANILFMFFNARVQGLSSDIRRLSGYSDGGAEAAKSAAALGSLIALPVTLNSIRNNSEYKEDLNKLTDWERANNIVIFKDSFVQDKNGEYVMDADGKPIRDAWKIPVRDTLGAVKNLTETIVESTYDKDESLGLKMVEFAGKTLENFAPINIQGDTAEERGQSIVASTNPLIKAFYEATSGVDPYRHTKIEPEYMGGEKTADLPKELRKKDTTPEWTIRLGELTGQSPLIIEKIANDFGAGMFTQFKGTDQRGNALSKRFIRSVYYKENEGFIKELENMKEKDAVKGIEEYSKAKVIYESLKEMGTEEKKRTMKELVQKGDVTEGIAKEIVKFADKDKFGYSREDSLLKDLSVENGDRAKALAKKMQTLDGTQKKEYVKNALEKKIITEKVAQQLSILISQNK